MKGEVDNNEIKYTPYIWLCRLKQIKKSHCCKIVVVKKMNNQINGYYGKAKNVWNCWFFFCPFAFAFAFCLSLSNSSACCCVMHFFVLLANKIGQSHFFFSEHTLNWESLPLFSTIRLTNMVYINSPLREGHEREREEISYIYFD